MCVLEKNCDKTAYLRRLHRGVKKVLKKTDKSIDFIF